MNIINPYRFGGLDLTNGLVSFWKLTEGTGLTRADSVGSNDLDDIGSVVNSSTMANIPYGAEADFGVSDRLRITDAAQTGLDITSSFTMSCFVDFDNTTSTQLHGIMGKYHSDAVNDRAYLVWYKATTPRKLAFLVSNDGTATTECAYSVDLTANTTYHVAARFDDDANELELFLDGVSVAGPTSHTTGISDEPADFSLGWSGFSTGASNFLDGQMSAAGIWNRALTDAEITELADYTSTFYDAY